MRRYYIHICRVVMSEKGSGVTDVIIGAAFIVFVLLPVFSVVVEKFIILNKAQIIKDAVDMTNISAYTAIVSEGLGREQVIFNSPEVESIYSSILAKNLDLDSGLSPEETSPADDAVIIDSIIIYTDEFPLICPNGTQIKRPSVHSVVTVPVKPSLYRQIILGMLGKRNIELKVHVDSDIPVNN